MSSLVTIKEATAISGLPETTIRNLCRSESCKNAVHRFGHGRTSPFYIDWDEMLKIIKSGKADK